MPGIYATADDVQTYLVSTIEVEDDEMDKAIAAAAVEVDDGVGPQYPRVERGNWKFKDHPDTPRMITTLTTWLAVSIILGVRQVQSDDARQLTDEEKFRRRAEDRLQKIRDGVIVVAPVDTESDDEGALIVSKSTRVFDDDFDKAYG